MKERCVSLHYFLLISVAVEFRGFEGEYNGIFHCCSITTRITTIEYNGYETAEDEEGIPGRVLRYYNVELYIIVIVFTLYV